MLTRQGAARATYHSVEVVLNCAVCRAYNFTLSALHPHIASSMAQPWSTKPDKAQAKPRRNMITMFAEPEGMLLTNLPMRLKHKARRSAGACSMESRGAQVLLRAAQDLWMT